MIADVVASAQELVSQQFPEGAEDTSDWLEGVPQIGARAAFAPIAVFESLHETPADYDGTAWRLWEEAFHGFEEQRQEAVAALAAKWGPPQSHSFRPEHDRVWAGDESVSKLEYDLAMFTGGEPFPAWRHGSRIIALLLGQMDKEFPIVLTLAALTMPDQASEGGAADR
ncbi:hypothetical protein M1L60_27835 [Actinoplanes sp. TRM 88003]|uniref:Uncharacterized protein n=1 Tax=Paractinoplanes aksuensis TaxID=2939490 RepID=A0ABT1DWI0_9ACTN|nr:hypothetical protein [Actinoplanes aksuensis]MCO8274416.1 hypothetical protein [Actinoplanes aksuensis]